MIIAVAELILQIPADSVAAEAPPGGSVIDWTEVIKIVPSLLWFILMAVLFMKFYRPIRYELLPKLAGIKAMGVELSFITKSIDAALDLAEKNRKWKVDVPLSAKDLVLKRAREHLKIFENAKILWVDDNPNNNANELRMFIQLKMIVEFVTSTEEALEKLRTNRYDLILSDMLRAREADAGIKFLSQLRPNDEVTPVIFYVGTFKPELGVPGGAFGITNRPDELLHLVMDALERKRY